MCANKVRSVTFKHASHPRSFNHKTMKSNLISLLSSSVPATKTPLCTIHQSSGTTAPGLSFPRTITLFQAETWFSLYRCQFPISPLSYVRTVLLGKQKRLTFSRFFFSPPLISPSNKNFKLLWELCIHFLCLCCVAIIYESLPHSLKT